MTIAREEIFGPGAVDPAVRRTKRRRSRSRTTRRTGSPATSRRANVEHAQSVAKRLRTGQRAPERRTARFDAPFGGYKQSGNGREWGVNGFEEFLETKAVFGFSAGVIRT